MCVSKLRKTEKLEALTIEYFPLAGEQSRERVSVETTHRCRFRMVVRSEGVRGHRQWWMHDGSGRGTRGCWFLKWHLGEGWSKRGLQTRGVRGEHDQLGQWNESFKKKKIYIYMYILLLYIYILLLLNICIYYYVYRKIWDLIIYHPLVDALNTIRIIKKINKHMITHRCLCGCLQTCSTNIPRRDTNNVWNITLIKPVWPQVFHWLDFLFGGEPF